VGSSCSVSLDVTPHHSTYTYSTTRASVEDNGSIVSSPLPPVMFGIYTDVAKGGKGLYLIVVSPSTADNTTIKLSLLQSQLAKNLALVDGQDWREKYKVETIILYDSDGTEIRRFEESITPKEVEKWIALYQKSMTAAVAESKVRPIIKISIPSEYNFDFKK
jgi:hypothetical protein